MHGGRAPQVKAAAELRLLALVDPAIAQLARLLRSSRSDQVRLGAVKDILDRAGLVGKQKIEVSGSFAEELNAGRERLLEEDERGGVSVAVQ